MHVMFVTDEPIPAKRVAELTDNLTLKEMDLVKNQ
jgi:hypothetical protein